MQAAGQQRTIALNSIGDSLRSFIYVALLDLHCNMVTGLQLLREEITDEVDSHFWILLSKIKKARDITIEDKNVYVYHIPRMQVMLY